MLFPSEEFLFVFLPVVVTVYYAFLRKTKKAKNIFLLITSLFFYAWGEPGYVFLMMATIAFNYAYGLLVDKFRDDRIKGRMVLFLMVMTNLAILGWFKYSVFAISNFNRFAKTSFPIPEVALPIGISFFTFQAMSYVIDVYRGHGKVQKNPLNVGLYIALFPQLIAGPIVRYETIAEQIDNRVEDLEDFSAGCTRFIIGLGKKVLLANNVAIVSKAAFGLIINNQFQASAAMAWLGAISFTLQILFDFSGYSDMAIGLGKMFGFHFEENFRYPYIATSVSEFWRRWHISLQTWFRDYIYIPLGGNRVSMPRLYLNMFIVWLATGIWHGANWTFIVWGLMYFVLLAFERATGLHKKKTWWGHIYTMFFVMIGWVIFNSTGMGAAILYIKAMFGIGSVGLIDPGVISYLKQYYLYYIVALLCCVPVMPTIDEKLKKYKAWNVVYGLGIVGILVLSVSFIFNNSYNPFIYFNF